jgi:DNA-binding NarL/FixJ family response regulator
LLDYTHDATQGTIETNQQQGTIETNQQQGTIETNQQQKWIGRCDMKLSRILVVDDYKPWRHKICSLLKTKPEFRIVAECWNGADAVERAGELKPNLITMDVGIPELNGIEAAVRVAEVSPSSKILFISGNTEPEVVLAAIDAGASGYLDKMRVGTELLPAVTSIIRGGCFFSPDLEGSTTYPEPTDFKQCPESTVMQLAHPY